MGINFDFLKQVEGLGVFETVGGRILDIGSSNLYAAKSAEVRAFIERYNPTPRSDIVDFSNRMEHGSSYDPVRGGTNEAFVGELLEAAGFGYDAIDIADGYKTTIVDMNRENLPTSMKGKYDIVFNCGTTEHILNQLNSFRIIHEATKIGGFICHQLPAIGYLDHGYFCYTGRFFFDLAGYNEYEIIDCWFDGSMTPESVYSSMRSYKNYFPSLNRTLDKIGSNDRENRIASFKIPTIGLNVFYRKTKDRPFMGTVEMSTSVGSIPGAVFDSYSPQTDTAVAVTHLAPIEKAKRSTWQRLRSKLRF